MARRSRRKNRPRATGRAETAPAGETPGWRSLEPELRASYLYGLLAAILGGGLFVFPVEVDPIEALALYLAMIVFGGVLAGAGFRQGGRLFLRRFGSVPALAVYVLAFWAFVRWKLARFPAGVDAAETVAIPSVGRDGVVAFQFLALAFALGLGLSAMPGLRSGAIWRSFRTLLAVAAFGFALLGIYQFFFGYESMLERLRQAQTVEARMDPLLLQSLEHALQERRVGGTLGNGNVFAAWLSLLAVACLSLLGRGAARGWRLAGGAGFLLTVFALLLTGSRGGILTLVVAVAGAGLVLWRTGGIGRMRAEQAGPASGGAAALMFSGGLFVFAARSAWAIDVGYRLTRITTIRERLNYWAVATKIWAENLFLGGGPGAFELFYPRLKALTARESRFAHSWIFHTGAELGLLGVVLFLVFWAGVAWAAWRCWKRASSRVEASEERSKAANREALWLALFSAVLAFNGLFEYSLHTPEFLAFLGLCSGGLSGLAFGSATAGESDGGLGLTARAGAAGLLFGVVIASSLLIVPRSQLATNWEWKAEGAMLADDPFLAAGYYSRASKLLPNDEGPVLRWSGALMQLAGRGEEAERLLERAESLNPLSARIRSAQARFYRRQERLEPALEKMNEAIELYPADAGYRLERAELLHRLGRDDAAREDLKFVEDNEIPIWRYLRPEFDALRMELGMGPTAETLKEQERQAKRKAGGEGERTP